MDNYKNLLETMFTNQSNKKCRLSDVCSVLGSVLVLTEREHSKYVYVKKSIWWWNGSELFSYYKKMYLNDRDNVTAKLYLSLAIKTKWNCLRMIHKCLLFLFKEKVTNVYSWLNHYNKTLTECFNKRESSYMIYHHHRKTSSHG